MSDLIILILSQILSDPGNDLQRGGTAMYGPSLHDSSTSAPRIAGQVQISPGQGAHCYRRRQQVSRFIFLWADLFLQIYLSHWPLGIWLQSQIRKFQTHFSNKYLKYFLWNSYQVNATTPHWSLVNIGSGWPRSLTPYGITRPQWVKTWAKWLSFLLTTLSNTLPGIIFFVFWFKFLVFFVRIWLMIREQVIACTNDAQSFCLWYLISSLTHNELTHCSLVTPYDDIELGQHWLR